MLVSKRLLCRRHLIERETARTRIFKSAPDITALEQSLRPQLHTYLIIYYLDHNDVTFSIAHTLIGYLGTLCDLRLASLPLEIRRQGGSINMEPVNRNGLRTG